MNVPIFNQTFPCLYIRCGNNVFTLTRIASLFLGVDTTRDDGFYSVALLKFQGNGKFPLKVRATSKDGDQTQLFVGGDSSSFYPPNGGR